MQLPSERARGLLRIRRLTLRFRIIRIHDQGDDSGVGEKLVQKPERFATQFYAEPAHPRDVPARPIEAGHEAGLDGVDAARKDDWDRWSCRLGRQN